MIRLSSEIKCVRAIVDRSKLEKNIVIENLGVCKSFVRFGSNGVQIYFHRNDLNIFSKANLFVNPQSLNEVFRPKGPFVHFDNKFVYFSAEMIKQESIFASTEQILQKLISEDQHVSQ